MLSTLLLTLAATAPASSPPAAGQALIEVQLGGAASLAELLAMDLDVAWHDRVSDRVELVADAADQAALESAGIPFEVAIPNLVHYYHRRAVDEEAPPAGAYGQWLAPRFANGSMGGFYTFDEVVSVLDQMRARYPELVSAKTSLGQSAEGRDLWMVKISDNPDVDEAEPEARFDALHHAREPQGMQTLLWFMLHLLEDHGVDDQATYLVNERELYFVLVVNPDGYVYNQHVAPGGGGLWRKNRRDHGDGSYGVDLDRNYPFQWGHDDVGSSPDPQAPTYRGTGAASEPEVAAMITLSANREFRTALSMHAWGSTWVAPWGYDEVVPREAEHLNEIGSLATAGNLYESGLAWELGPPANGIAIDADLGQHGTLSWAPRIGGRHDGYWPAPARIAPLADENLAGCIRTALAAGAYIRLVSSNASDQGDGDGFYEPGETVDLILHLRNSGTLGTSAPVVSILDSLSLDITILNPIFSFGSVPAFSNTDNEIFPLSLRVLSSAPTGARIPYGLILGYEGWTRRIARRLFVGETTPVVLDDLDHDFGFRVGSVEDTATGGRWELATPVGTQLDGAPFAPEGDFSPGPGGLCYVTGNAGAPVDADDVDGGSTTLVSPAVHLSQMNEPRLGYARWFASNGGVDDSLVVSISSDDGLTWTPVETVRESQPEWHETVIRVEDHVERTDSVRLRWVVTDGGAESLVEAAIDEVSVIAYDDRPRLNVYGQPDLGAEVVFSVTGPPGESVLLFNSRFVGETLVEGVEGTLLLDRDHMSRVALGTIPANGLLEFRRQLPASSALEGTTFYLQAIVRSNGSPTFTNRDEFTLE